MNMVATGQNEASVTVGVKIYCSSDIKSIANPIRVTQSNCGNISLHL